jgi:tRNA threonylcarbamoyl adenosine modification protein YeaZ
MSAFAPLLILDTALSYVQVTFRNSVGSVFVNSAAQKDTSALHAMIESVLDKNENTQPEAVAVVAGPGSFTGLRVAMSAAKGLCFAWGIPLIPLDTLQLFAWQALSTGFECPSGAIILSLLEARKDEVYFALFDHKGRRLIEDSTARLSKEWYSSLGKVAVISGSLNDTVEAFSKFNQQKVFLCSVHNIQHEVCLSLADYHKHNYPLEYVRSCSPNYVKEAYIKGVYEN